jgi:hypothetical protein
MKLEEASNVVVHMYRDFNLTEKEKSALDEAYKCLQKGIARKPVARKAYLRCPTCDRQLTFVNVFRRRNLYDHCIGCGQFIDWEDV